MLIRFTGCDIPRSSLAYGRRYSHNAHHFTPPQQSSCTDTIGRVDYVPPCYFVIFDSSCSVQSIPEPRMLWNECTMQSMSDTCSFVDYTTWWRLTPPISALSYLRRETVQFEVSDDDDDYDSARKLPSLLRFFNLCSLPQFPALEWSVRLLSPVNSLWADSVFLILL